jgi:hypothetical protein
MHVIGPVGGDAVEPDLERLLRMRIETIRTNLEQVKLAKDFVAGRRSDIAEFGKFFEEGEGIRAAIRGTIKIQLNHSKDYANAITAQNDTQRRNLASIIRDLDEAIENLDTIAKVAETTEKIALTMMTRWAEFPGDSFDRHVDDSFSTEARDLLDKIANIDYTDLAQAWRTYRVEIRDQSEALFSEYVEFLGGLALRDTGLGGLLPSPLPQRADELVETLDLAEGDHADEAEYNRDVCVMADELIRQIYYIGTNDLWHSMAVPGRTLTTARSISRMIRLGFPDWTVWAVPLAGYQFGLVVVDESQLIENYPDPTPIQRSDLRVVLADAFATFALGPAYALASILIKLEPSETDAGEPLRANDDEPFPAPLSDTERVRTILETLRFMNEGSIFDGLISHLDEWWKASMELNGAEPAPTPASVERVTAWCNFMHEFLGTHGGKIRYPASKWGAAMQWPSLIALTGPSSTERPPGPELRNVRDLLSAAWYQRVTSNDQSRDIAIAALTFWRRTIKGPPSTGGSPTGRRG